LKNKFGKAWKEQDGQMIIAAYAEKKQ